MEKAVGSPAVMAKRKFLAFSFWRLGMHLTYDPFLSSGLLDISHLLDLDPSSVFLVNSMTCPSAMSVLVNPGTDFNTPLSTYMPTQYELCGDGSCAATENADNCQSDCGNKSLTASSIGLFGAKGVMFTVKSSRDIVVTSLGFYKNLDDASIVEASNHLIITSCL